MTNSYHVAIWVDHEEAKIFSINSDVHFMRVQNPSAGKRVHHHAGSVGSGHPREDAQYLRAVADALSPAHEILVTGPSQMKNLLMDWMKLHAPQTARKVLGIETLDHPTNGELVSFARTYFRTKDRMTPQLQS